MIIIVVIRVFFVCVSSVLLEPDIMPVGRDLHSQSVLDWPLRSLLPLPPLLAGVEDDADDDDDDDGHDDDDDHHHGDGDMLIIITSSSL